MSGADGRGELAELRAVIARLVEMRRAAPGADLEELDRLAAQAGIAGEEPPPALSVEGVEVTDAGGAVRVRLQPGTADDPRAGIVFYDEHGREAGGLTYRGTAAAGAVEAVHELVFAPADATGSIRLVYSDRAGDVTAGVEIGGPAGGYFGKRGDTSLLVLRDLEGRDRLRVVVDPNSAPRVEFLDEAGRVTRTLD